MPADNKSIVRRLYEEVWNERKIEVLQELLSPSHALHIPGASGSKIGPEVYKRTIQQFITAFPDLRFDVEDTVSENDKVVAGWTISGTHQGEYLGIPATGQKISVEGVTIHHVAGGKIMDSFVNYDALGLMQQLGVVPHFGLPKSVSAH